MFLFNQLRDQLSPVNRRYSELKAVFEKFHQTIKAQLDATPSPVAGAIVSVFAQDQFTITFAGRTLRFRFSAVATQGSATLHGSIDCHLMSRDEFDEPLLLSSVPFDGKGETDMVNPDNKTDKMTVTDDLEALHIAMHNLHESLSKPQP